MAPITVKPDTVAGERLTVESIPLVDLRFLTQSELSALSRCSVHAVDLSRCDDVIIPKIDRSVFNESAGSRKQTYSRFRLARRKSDFSAKPLPLARGPPPDDPERLDNSKIVDLFKQLFNGGASQGVQLASVTLDMSETPSGPSAAAAASADVGDTLVRKRGRKPKCESEGGQSQALVVYDDGAGREQDKATVNKNGVVVDLQELAKLDDPFALEISRRTSGMAKDDELLGYLTSLDGQWGSRRRRRKIVDANVFGDALPDGWKVLVAMKKKQGNCWLFCRRYISPSGRYFKSCKEVSSYLMSINGFTSVKQPAPDASHVEDRPESVNAETTHDKHEKGVSASPATFEPDDHKEHNNNNNNNNNNNLVKEGHVSIPQEFGGLLKCHKCSTPFNEKNHLLHHLVSCHKRKRRKAGMPTEDDELIKGGHYECQFCNKRFTERVSFFGHVGIHVKNYMKGLEGSPGINPMPNNDVSVSMGGLLPLSTLEKPESMEVNDESTSLTPNLAASNDINVESFSGKLPTESDPKDARSGHNEDILAFGIDRACVERSTDIKGDAVPELMDEEVEGAENYTDTADLKLDSCSDYEDFRPGEPRNDTCQASIRDIAKASDVIIDSEVQMQNSDGLIYEEAKKSPNLLNDVHGFSNEVEDSHVEQIFSEPELFGNDENKPVDENTKEMLTSNVGDQQPRYSTELNHSFISDEAMFGSGNNEIQQKWNATSESHQESIPTRSSFVPREDEETSLPGFLCGRHTEQTSSAQDNLQCSVVEDDANIVSLSTSNGMDLEAGVFGKNEVSFDADSFNSNRRDAQSVFVLPGDVISNVVHDNANTVSAFRGNLPFPSSLVVPQAEHLYGTESSSPSRTSSRKEPNSAGFLTSANFFNQKSSLDANPVADKEVVTFSSSHLYSPLGNREVPSRNLFGMCNSAMEDSKRKRDSESVISSLSVGGHDRSVSGRIQGNRGNMPDDSSPQCATHLQELGSSIRDINSGILPSFPPQNIPAASPSPFSLWNDQSFGVEHSQNRVCESSREEGGRVSGSSSLSLAGFQQTCNVGYNLNETYISTVDNFSRLSPLETHRDTDLMIGFRNLNARSNQDVVSGALWRSNEGNALPSDLGGSSSSQGQLPSAFQPFDFLSDKGENDIFSVSEKYDNMGNFGLRSSAGEPMEFSFLSPQDSNPQLGGPKVLSYANAGIEQGYESSVWLGKDTSLPNMNARSSYSSVNCVWCGSQFLQESIDSDTQAGSIGYLCPTCKARMSGQF